MVERHRITSWVIVVDWSTGDTEHIADIPNDIASAIDGWLTQVESEKADQVEMLNKVGAEPDDTE